MTERAITDPEHLRRILHEIRESGYAVNISENRANIRAIGAAVLDAEQRPVAGVAISMPDVRFDHRRVPHWGALVVDAAKAISANLG